VEPGSVLVKPKLAEPLPLTVGGVDAIVLFGGTVSTVQALLAVAPVLPAASVERTPKVWAPFGSPEYEAGLVHVENAPPSRRHWKLSPGSLSANTKLALVRLVGFAGPEAMAGAGGGVVSIVHEKAVGPPVWLSESVARTLKVWLPSGVAPKVSGLVQGANALVSSWHWKVLGLLFDVNVKVGLTWFEGFGGPVVIVTTGLTVSTVQVNGFVIEFPAASVPLSVNVCEALVRLE
jgi:hypothetical protein